MVVFLSIYKDCRQLDPITFYLIVLRLSAFCIESYKILLLFFFYSKKTTAHTETVGYLKTLF